MTKEQTTILKGVAILMMLFLHLFNGSNLTEVCEPLLFIGNTPLVHIISKACNPVGIFLMLSGYGLSYTSFAYGAVECASRFDANGHLKVAVNVTNTGERDGEETVQLYVADKVASMVRPVKELKGFKKVPIKRGETLRVEFDLHVRDLGFYTNSMKYVVEPGEFEIMVGPNSEELKTKTVVWEK